jgi:hypothetical protein
MFTPPSNPMGSFAVHLPTAGSEHETPWTRLMNRLNSHDGGYHIHGTYRPGTGGCVEFKDYEPARKLLHDFDAQMQIYFSSGDIVAIPVYVNYPK